jgi:serine/threonine protein kinase
MRLDESTTKYIMAQIVSAVGHIHKLGFAHRDLKPDNILIDLSGYIKLIDLGLAKRLTPDSRASSIVGT